MKYYYKNYFFYLILLLLLSSQLKSDIVKKELHLSINDQNILKNMKKGEEKKNYLVKKAILNESMEEKYTDEEKQKLRTLLENTEMEFYLSEYMKKLDVNVTDEETKNAFDQNRAKLKGIKYSDAKEELKKLITNAKKEKLLKEKINEITNEYKIEDIVLLY